MSESRTFSFVPDIIAGTINGIIIIVSAMALAALVFSGPLAPYLPQGIGVLLVGSLVFAVFSAFTSKFPITISPPQDIPIAILTLMALTLIAGAGQSWLGAQLFSFMFAAIGITDAGLGTKISIIDSTSIEVIKNKILKRQNKTNMCGVKNTNITLKFKDRNDSVILGQDESNKLKDWDIYVGLALKLDYSNNDCMDNGMNSISFTLIKR